MMKKFLTPVLGIASGLAIWQLLPGLTSKLIALAVVVGLWSSPTLRKKMYPTRDTLKRTTTLLLAVAILSGSMLPAAQGGDWEPGPEVPEVQAAFPWRYIGWALLAMAGGAIWDGTKWVAVKYWTYLEGVSCCEGGMDLEDFERPGRPKCLVPGRNRYTGCVD